MHLIADWRRLKGISAATLLVALFGIAVVLADPMPEAHAADDVGRLAELLVDVCPPQSPSSWIAAAEKRAAAAGWMRDPARFGPMFGLARSPEEQTTPIQNQEAWFIKPNEIDGSDLSVQVTVDPAMPLSSCVVSRRGAASLRMIAALRAKLGLGRLVPMFGMGKGWIIAQSGTEVTSLVVTEQRLAAGPGRVPPGGGATIPGPTKIRTYAAVIRVDSAPGQR